MTTPTTSGTARTAARKAAAPKGTTTSGAQASGQATQKSLEQHLATLAEGEVLDPQGLYEFLDAARALFSGAAFFVHAAASQVEAAARKGARDNTDGRLTLAQKAKLQLVLRRMGRQMNGRIAEDLLAAAKSSVTTYAILQDFLEEIESDTIDRPHRGSRGGFNLHRS